MRNLHSLFLTILLLLGFTSVHADTVKMKDGTSYDGKIELQTPDLIKIVVPITDKIKETKTLAMTDVSEVIKTAPDDEMFSEIQKMVPTSSMVSAEKYRSMLQTGPEAFLSQFAGSKHKERVEVIKKTLEEELDKVERGNLKLEGTWYSPQDRNNFQKLIESKIVLFRMKNAVRGGRYYSNIAAMREYEQLETNYFGTPAHAEAISAAQNILPNLGRQIQGLRRDVDVKNAQWEASKNALNTIDRQRVEAARAREESQFAAAVATDKKAKIKWTRVNPRSASALDSYIQFVSGELKRVKAYDAELIKKKAEALLEVDKIIAEGKLDRANIKLSAALAMPTNATGKKSSSSSKKSTSYSGALQAKLKEKISERKEIAKAQSDAKKSAALAADLNETKTETSGQDLLDGVADSNADKKTEETTDEDDFDLLASADSKKKEEPKKETTTKKKPTKPKKEPRTYEPAKKPFPFHLIGIFLAVLAGGAVVAMKVLGIGGAKEDGDE